MSKTEKSKAKTKPSKEAPVNPVAVAPVAEKPKTKAKPVARDNALLNRALGMSASLQANIASQDEYIIKDHFQNTGFPGINLILSLLRSRWRRCSMLG